MAVGLDAQGRATAALAKKLQALGLKAEPAQLERESDGARVPSIVFTEGGGAWLEAIAATGCDAVGVDWTVDIGQARARIGHLCALQGNLDPAVLLAGREVVRSEARRILRSFGLPRNADGTWAGHVFNLGHGISRFTPVDAVATLVQTVHEESRRARH